MALSKKNTRKRKLIRAKNGTAQLVEGKGKVGDKGLRKEERRRLFQELEACACARGLHGSGKKWGGGWPQNSGTDPFLCLSLFGSVWAGRHSPAGKDNLSVSGGGVPRGRLDTFPKTNKKQTPSS